MSDTAPKIDPEVLDAARRTMRQHGWKGTTADRIATEAGISRVTLHRRGIKREHILTALTEIAVDAYREAMWPPLVGDGTGAERVKQGLNALCEVAEEHLEVLTALSVASDEIFHEPAAEGDEVETRTPFTEPIERLLSDGIGDGTIQNIDDPRETATVLFNAVGWTYIHLRTGHNWPPPKARNMTLDLVLNGLLNSRASGN